MQENTNKAIIINTTLLYVRLFVSTVTGLLTTRFALLALGVNDFGIFSVIGSIISFIAIINTIMLSTSNRFISIAIGKGDEREINNQFNVNLIVHVAIAIGVLIIAFPIGDWYISNYVNYEGCLDTVVRIFNVTIIGSVISFISVPYNGLIVAKERFSVICLTDIIYHLVKLGVTYSLLFYFQDKLFVYTLTNSVLAALPTFVFLIYCKCRFDGLVKFTFVRDIKKYKEVLAFSVWVGFGAVASVGKVQGSALIVNMFFTSAMNAALGLANSVNVLIKNIAGNATVSIAPQITKSYAAGNLDRSESLVCFASKISYLLMLLIVSPFFVAPNFIFNLWLGTVPEYVVLFTQLLIIDALIGSLNAGIPNLVFATGRIKVYQIVESTILILSIIVAFFFLKAGAPAHALLVIYIVFSAIVLVVRQVLLNRVVKFDNKLLFKKSYLPSLIVTVFSTPALWLNSLFSPLLAILIAAIYISVIIFALGLNNKERSYLIEAFKRVCSRFLIKKKL